ncbi:MAG TPA: hypothetical protein O0X50_00320 [Methanocorpusculum sp.]|nr:hypothetical protein [Methanocorpusculum sp.]
MKQPRNIFIILLLVGILTIGSAGCISLGTQTSEILVGNQTVGTVTLTPAGDSVNVGLDLLGDKSFINNLSDANKTELLRLLTGNSSIDLSSFIADTKTDATADEETDFWSKIMNMKLSSGSDKTLSESFSVPDLDTTINDAMDSLNEFLERI